MFVPALNMCLTLALVLLLSRPWPPGDVVVVVKAVLAIVAP